MVVFTFLTRQAKLFWTRLTLSRISIAYSLFALAYCLAQVALQTATFAMNTKADIALKTITHAAHLPDPAGADGLVVLRHNQLQKCILANRTTSCSVVWTLKGGSLQSNLTAQSEYASSTNGSDSTVQPNGSGSVSSLSSISSTTTSTSVVASSAAMASATATSSSSVPPASAQSEYPSEAAGTKYGIQSSQSSAEFEGSDGSKITLFPNLGRRGAPKLSVEAPQYDANGSLVSLDVIGATSTSMSTPGDGNSTFVIVKDPNGKEKITIDRACVNVLPYALQELAESGREDVVFLGFNVWVLGMSLVAITNESIPHLAAALITHLLTIGWTIFQVFNTIDFERNFLKLTQFGACPGVNLLPAFWHIRVKLEITQIVLSAVSLLFSAYLSYRLFKQFGWQNFKKVGASPSINLTYKLVLALEVILQLSVFFLLAGVALWLREITVGLLKEITTHSKRYEVASLVIAVLLIPWILCGILGTRRENKILTSIYISGALLILASWSSLFVSRGFRLLFSTWSFFAMMIGMAMALTVLDLAAGIICLLRFGKENRSLREYLKPESGPMNEKRRDYSDDLDVESGTNFNGTKGFAVQFPDNSALPTYDLLLKRMKEKESNVSPVSQPPAPARTTSQMLKLIIPAKAHTSAPSPSDRAALLRSDSASTAGSRYSSATRERYTSRTAYGTIPIALYSPPDLHSPPDSPNAPTFASSNVLASRFSVGSTESELAVRSPRVPDAVHDPSHDHHYF